MDLAAAIAVAKDGLRGLVGLEVAGVTQASPLDGGWLVTLEMLERRMVPETQDVLGVYEVELKNGRVARYERRRVRRRVDVEELIG